MTGQLTKDIWDRTTPDRIARTGRVGKNLSFFFNPAWWFFWFFSGFIGFFNFHACDTIFLLYIIAFKCSP
jgi:hypothetical protein